MALLAGTAAAVAGCQNGLQAGMTDPIEDVVGGNPLVALGLQADPNEQEIEYGPRSPLVMPKDDGQLPPPQQQQLSYGADWPDDPDERRKAQARAKREAAIRERQKPFEDMSDVVSREELESWGGKTGVSTSDYQRQGWDTATTVDPRDLRRGTVEPGETMAEPERRTLAEPPEGYRAPATAEDGTVVGGDPEPKKKSWFRRMMGG